MVDQAEHDDLQLPDVDNDDGSGNFEQYLQSKLEYFPKQHCHQWIPSIPMRFKQEQQEKDYQSYKLRFTIPFIQGSSTVLSTALLVVVVLEIIIATHQLAGLKKAWAIRVSAFSLLLMLGGSMAWKPSLFSPARVCTVHFLVFSLIMVFNPFRARALAGELDDNRALIDHDHFTLLPLAGVIAWTHHAAVDNRTSLVVTLLSPIVYWAGTWPLPEPSQLGSHSTVTALFLLLLTSLYFVATRGMDLNLRRGFLVAAYLKETAIKEKVMRCDAERAKESLTSSPQKIGAQEDNTSVGLSTAIFSLTKGSQGEARYVALRELAKAENWLVPAEFIQFSEESLLGRGGYGTVIKGLYLRAPVALKVPRRSQRHLSELDILGGDLRLLRRCHHPNIVSFYGICALADRSSSLLLVEEFIDGCKLANLFDSDWHVALPDRKYHDILVGILSAMVYLHSCEHAIIHGDLKPDNIMLTTGDLQPKLVDFGLALLEKTGSKTKGGTLSWRAPETLTSRKASTKSDVYSFGKITYFMATQGVIPVLTNVQVAAGHFESPPWPAQSGDVEWKTTASTVYPQCTSIDPDARPSAFETLRKFAVADLGKGVIETNSSCQVRRISL